MSSLEKQGVSWIAKVKGSIFDELRSIEKESGLQKDNYQGDAVIEALTMPTGTVGLENEFEDTLSLYDQSYQCLIEDLVRKQSGTGDVDTNTIYMEWDHLGKLENKLVSLIGGLSTQNAESGSISRSLELELDAKKQHLLKISDTLLPSAAGTATSGSATVGTTVPTPNVSTPSTGAATHPAHTGGSLSAKEESSGLYARMFYTRLIFWAILVIMLLIAIIHAYSSDEPSLALNTVAIMVALICLYYSGRWLYRKFFY